MTPTKLRLFAASLAAFSLPLLNPTPAAAWWYHRDPGWHAGYGWRPGVVVGVAPPIVAVPPPVVYAPPPVFAGRVWIRPHWSGPYWVPGHWG